VAEQLTDKDDIREIVRERYAEAALTAAAGSAAVRAPHHSVAAIRLR
jgi:hypothetical protein